MKIILISCPGFPAQKLTISMAYTMRLKIFEQFKGIFMH